MAGSYNHAIGRTGKLLNNENFVQMVENLGDAYETVEEMYGMIWYLADGDKSRVEEAQLNYKQGLRLGGRQRGRE